MSAHHRLPDTFIHVLKAPFRVNTHGVGPYHFFFRYTVLFYFCQQALQINPWDVAVRLPGG